MDKIAVNESEIVSISLPPTMAAEIRREAHKHETSVSRYMRLLYLNSVGKKEEMYPHARKNCS